jgi:hypothetical protein
MPQNTFSMQSFEARRVRVESTRSLEEVLLNLRNIVGTTIIQQENIQEAGSAPTREQFEHVIGSSDLSLFESHLLV